ncbi:MAG: class I SAM-dependent methyltransferase [Chitinophagales bacterium]|nr:class I SAM-dependent methyltransferase [Chitinophagales bacterium]
MRDNVKNLKTYTFVHNAAEVRQNWFEIWFNTHYHDLLYQHRDEEEAAHFMQALIDFLKPSGNAAMLDVACGKGRHALFMAEKGFDVTGTDLSYKNIREAIRDEKQNLSFFQHDMRTVFRTNYFDFIFNLYTSFGYFADTEDDLHTIRSFYLGLKPAGILIIDFFNVHYVLKHLVEDESKLIDDIQFNISKSFEQGFVVKEIEVFHNERRFVFHERVKAIKKQDFEVYFEKNKLKLIHVFGDYKLNPYDEQTSERLILIAQK